MQKASQLIERAIKSLPEHAQFALEYAKVSGKAPVVYMGMSGGVDSSVSAYILKQAGFDVHGVFIKTWQPDDIECTWKDDRRDAMRICAVLGIPFETIYLEDEYKQHVADYMIREYSRGRTPNPDIMCNKHVKFGGFYTTALESGADFVATGHYAKTKTVVKMPRSISAEEQKARYDVADVYLMKARDEVKDQTYFLWATEASYFKHILFPVGDLLKEEVRVIAEYAGLPVFDKKDSQGVCFIGKLDMKDFLKGYIKTERGPVYDASGQEIGEHDGALLYTIGERHGFRLFNSTPESEARFVIRKDIEHNALYVGTHAELLNAESASSAILEDVNFVSKNYEGTKSLKARIRHRQKLQAVEAEPILPAEQNRDEILLKISFKESQQGIASGQSCVLYDGEICLGGGIIK